MDMQAIDVAAGTPQVAPADVVALGRAKPGWSHAALLDRIEQFAVVLLWIGMVYRVAVSANPFAPLLLISETAVVVFVLIRRPTQAISLRAGDWLLAITATAAPLLVLPHGSGAPVMVPVALGFLLVGNMIQLAAKLILRRSFGIAPANRGIKRGGPYMLVRHPMYAGYLLTHIAILALIPSWTNAAIYAVAWTAQIFRLVAEERLLSEDETYRAYARDVRYRLIPGIY